MRAVWKFPLEVRGAPCESVPVAMPRGAKVVHVDTQQSKLSVWADVDTTAPLEAREFLVVATGVSIPVDATHVGSFGLHNGYYIFHVYEVEPL